MPSNMTDVSVAEKALTDPLSPWSARAPPDVVAPLAIARRLNLPRRILVILEGEGLANDATALILYRFALAAIMVGHFSLPLAAFGSLL